MEFLKITSAANPRIKETVRLRERKHAGGENLIVIEGIRIIETALSAGVHVREVFFADHFGARKEGRAILKTLQGNGVTIFSTTEQLLNKITDTETPQGIAAVVSYELFSLESLPVIQNPLYTVADGVREPGNLGTIVRISDAAGADAVILLEETCDILISKAVRAAAGSIFHIPVVRARSETFVKWLQKRGIMLTQTSKDAGISVFDAKLDGPVALAFGNEARGISSVIRKAAALSLKIPIYGKAESINVAMAAAVCIYEAARQRKSGQGCNGL
jgi:TrmH family RNA methyltransferase